MCFHTTVLSVRGGYRGINVIRCFLDVYYKIVDKLVNIRICTLVFVCSSVRTFLYDKARNIRPD